MKVCEKCNKNPGIREVEGYTGLYCTPCGGVLHANYQARKKTAIANLGKVAPSHICKYCKISFSHKMKKVNFCSDSCRKQDNQRSINKNWEAKPEYEYCKNGIRNNFHTSHAYVKEPEFLKKFKSCRG